MRENRARATLLLAPLIAVSLLPAGARAQASDTTAAPEDLAKQLANPISALVSLPFQFNWDQDVGPRELTRFVLNVQPVIPFTLSADWNLIARVIAPLIGQPPLAPGGSAAFGMGDLVTSFFLSPSGSSWLTWGFGPVFLLPSTHEPTLGTGKWGSGPTIVALKQTGPWTMGALWNQIWSFAGDSDRGDVSQMLIQPFFAYQATRTITITLQSETTSNWEAEDDDDRWTAPIHLLVGKLSSFGPFPASYQIGGGVFVAHPEVGPKWRIRAAIVLLLPKTQG